MTKHRLKKIIQKLHKKKMLLTTDEFINYIVRQPKLRNLIINNVFQLNDIEKHKYNKALQKYNEEIENIMNELSDDDFEFDNDFNENMEMFYFNNEFKKETLIFNNKVEASIIDKKAFFSICDQLKHDFSKSIDEKNITEFNNYLDFYLNNYICTYLIDYVFNILEQSLLFSNSEHNVNLYLYMSDFFEEPAWRNFKDKDIKIKNYLINHSISFLKGMNNYFSILDTNNKEVETYINAVAILIVDFLGDNHFESVIDNYGYFMHETVSNYDFLIQVYNENITNILRSEHLSEVFVNFIKDNHVNQILSYVNTDLEYNYHIFENPKNIKEQVKNHIHFEGGFIFYNSAENSVFYFIYDINDNIYKIIDQKTIKNSRYNVLEKIFLKHIKKE